MDTFPIEVLANIFAFLGSDFVFFFFLNPLRFSLARETDTQEKQDPRDEQYAKFRFSGSFFSLENQLNHSENY